MKKILTISVIALTLALSPAVASAKGGSGTIVTSGPNAGCVGKSQNYYTCLYADPGGTRQFTGSPDLITYSGGAQFWGFYYPGNGKTNYTFHYFSADSSWKLVDFYTRLQRFQTSAGSRVGMALGEVKRREGRRLKVRSICCGGWNTMREGIFQGAVYFYFDPAHRLTGIELKNF